MISAIDLAPWTIRGWIRELFQSVTANGSSGMTTTIRRRSALATGFAFIAMAILTCETGCSKKESSSPADLVKTLKEHQDPNMRAWAARELGRLPGKNAGEAIASLTEALRDKHDDVRMAAAYGLADLGKEAESAVPALTEATQDRSTQVRTAATYALKQIQRQK